MKHILIAIISSLFMSVAIAAPMNNGACVYPKTKVLPNGYLGFEKEVHIYDAPNGKDIAVMATAKKPMRVVSKKGDMIQISSTTEKENNGWVYSKQMDQLAERNCQL